MSAAAKDFFDEKYHGQGKATAQKLYEFYQQPQMLLAPEKAEKAWVEIPLEVKKKEPLRLVLNSTTAPDFGRYQPSLNGVKLGGPLDFYSDKVANNEFHLWTSGPSPASTRFGSSALARTPIGRFRSRARNRQSSRPPSPRRRIRPRQRQGLEEEADGLYGLGNAIYAVYATVSFIRLRQFRRGNKGVRERK